jgi:hypothetical protein
MKSKWDRLFVLLYALVALVCIGGFYAAARMHIAMHCQIGSISGPFCEPGTRGNPLRATIEYRFVPRGQDI